MRSQDQNIPASANYSRLGNTTLDTSWGVTLSGIQMFNGISGEGTDPFYPTEYGRCTDRTQCVEGVDICLIHPENTGHLHYHVPSPCMADHTWDDNGVTAQRNDVISSIRSAYELRPYRTLVGISKDGRPIYSPYYSNGRTYSDCDVDICNGKEINGHYAYVSTLFHPYVMGCYGPGSNPSFSQQCSSNARACGVVTNTFSGALKIAASLLALATSMIVIAF